MASIVTKFEIKNLASLEKALAQVTGQSAGPAPAIWRGHGVARWRLLPEVLRDTRYDEIGMTWDFVMRASSRMPNPPSHRETLAWLHIAQHYGLPTRLLDWSYSALVALYFAVADPKHDDFDGCIWALQPSIFNLQQVEVEDLIVSEQSELEEMVGPAFHEDAPKPAVSAYAITAAESDLRMLVQQAAFTIHRDRRADIRSIRNNKSYLRQFIIRKQHKGTLRTTLRSIGVARSTLFPDLASLAFDIKENPHYRL